MNKIRESIDSVIKTLFELDIDDRDRVLDEVKMFFDYHKEKSKTHLQDLEDVRIAGTVSLEDHGDHAIIRHQNESFKVVPVNPTNCIGYSRDGYTITQLETGSSYVEGLQMLFYVRVMIAKNIRQKQMDGDDNV